MSADSWSILNEKLAAGESEQAKAVAEVLIGAQNISFRDLTDATRYAINAKQSTVALVLLAGDERFLRCQDSVPLQEFLSEMTTLLAACWREKMDEPARKIVDMSLHALSEPLPSKTRELAEVVSGFARMAGRLALLRKDDAWFEIIAVQTMTWMALADAGTVDGQALPVLESWMHRIVKHERLSAVSVIFAVMALLVPTAADRKKFSGDFLREWRVAAATACLNPQSRVSAAMVEQLLLFAIKLEDKAFWPPAAQTIGEVAGFAITRNGVAEGFSVLRPLLDVGRVMLGDELKFGTGTDTDSLRQLIIRLICEQTLRVCNLAARNDITAVTGDKLEEMYINWMGTLEYEPHIRSIRRFCQLLLIIWSHKHRRAAKKWAPRETELAEPLLLSGEDQAKLAFLL